MAHDAAWADYWRDHRGRGCLATAPPLVHATLDAIWQAFAATLPPGGRVLDIAAGDGAVIRALRAVRPDLDIIGVDYVDTGPDAAALGVRGGVDAADLPFADGAFDAVTSQYGIEYCPGRAIGEAARVLASGAALAFVCHHSDSRVAAHNRRRLAAMRAMADAGLFALAQAVAAGGAEDALTVQAITRARETYRDQSIIEDLPIALGQALAGPQPPAAVAVILGRAEAEMARLHAMISAAMDRQGAVACVGALGAHGAVAQLSPVVAGAVGPIGWQIAARLTR